MILEQLASEKAEVENSVQKGCKEEGNPKAISILYTCFEADDAGWRGIGTFPMSGLELREEFSHRDFRSVFTVDVPAVDDHARHARAEMFSKGSRSPVIANSSERHAHPDKPVGPCMVSSEGSCAAYYKYMALGKIEL